MPACLVESIVCCLMTIQPLDFKSIPEALNSLYRSPGYKKNQLVLCKNYVLVVILELRST